MWFNKKPVTITFSITDVTNTDTFLLSANVNDAEGSLILFLNGEEIYNKATTGGNLDPVILPKELIQLDNTLELKVNSVGAKFWKTNKYQLEDVKITAEFTDRSAMESRNIFLVSSTGLGVLMGFIVDVVQCVYLSRLIRLQIVGSDGKED